jgi:DNA-binding transcriptional LysR family regulator
VERHQLEYLVAIVEHGSFTRAAASLRVAQPSLSRAMKSLERELGVELFRRTGRDIVVTDLASDLARRARMIMHDFDALAAAAHAGAGPVGRIEVAATPSTSIEPMTTVVEELRHRHPGLTVSALPSRNSAEVVAAVDQGRCEVGLCGQPHRPVGAHVTATPIGHDEVVVVTPPGSPLNGRPVIEPSALAGLRFVVAPARTTLRAIFEQVAGDIGDYEVAVEVGHREAIVPMVLRGVGVALHMRGWTRLAEQAGAGASSLDPPLPVPMWLVRRHRVSEAATAVVDAVRRHAET